MSTGAIIAIVIGVVIVLAVLWFVARAGRDRKLESRRVEAREIRREALRAMGEELPDDDEEGAASAPKAKKKRKKAEDAPEPPIRSVQFSSFIIQ